MKIRAQLKQLNNASEVSHNKFINMLAVGIIDAVQKINPDLVLTPMARSNKKGSIYLTLNGRTVVSDDKTGSSVDEYMNRLKNEAELVKQLKD